MSELNDIITKLCPDGVPYKPMWAITTWDKKFNGVDKKKQPAINRHHYYLAKELEPLIAPNGDIKVLTTSPSDLYTTAELAKGNIKDGEIVAIPWGGNAIVQYYNGKYITSDNRIAIANDEKQLNCKFLYYVLKNREKELAKYYRGAGIKHPDMFKVLHMEIPVPPLPVQAEVVRILDCFTELKAELEAELVDRREQYEYYRDQLLSQKNLEAMDGKPVETKKLDEVFNLKNGYTPSKSNAEYWKNGDVNWFRMDDIRANGRILNDSIQKVSMDGIKGGKLFEADSLIVSTSATIGEHALITVPFMCNQRFACLTRKPAYKPLLDMKFMFYYASKLDRYCLKNINKGGFASVSMPAFKKFPIPLPSIATQERIVDILDRFDTLTTSLTDGIPAEITMRHEQYEYFRSRLLDFPRLPEEPDDTNSVGE